MTDVKIVLTAIDRASKELRQAEDALRGVKTQGGNTALMFTELNSKINIAREAFRVFTGTFKKVFEFGKAGAAIELTQQRFDRLAQTIGTTGDVLREDLSRAVAGLMSDADSMQLATDLMSLGLAKTHDEAVRLTRVASELGMNMSQLVLTLTNQTTMRFDALGVAVDGFEEKVKSLEAAGHETNEAFKLAFIQQAEAQIKRLGGVSETTAGAFMRMDASVKNAGDAIKIRFAPFIADAANAVTVLLTASEKITEALEKQRDAALDATKTYEDYVEIQRQYGRQAGIIVATQNELDELLAKNAITIHHYADAIVIMDRAEYSAWMTAQLLGDSRREAIEQYQKIIPLLYEKSIMTSEMITTEQRLAIALVKTAEETINVQNATRIAHPAMKEFLDGIDRHIESPISEFIKDLQWYMATGGKFERAFLDIQLNWKAAGGLTDQEAADLATRLLAEEQKAKILAGMETTWTAIVNIREGAGVTWTEASALLKAAMGDTTAIQTQIDDLVMDWTIEATDEQDVLKYLSKSHYDLYATVHWLQVGVPPKIGPLGPPIPIPPGGIPRPGPGAPGPGGPGGQHGLDIIVPPGYPRDTYPIRASSGERVTIAPQSRQATGITIGNLNIIGTGGMDEEMLAAEVIVQMARMQQSAARTGYMAG